MEEIIVFLILLVLFIGTVKSSYKGKKLGNRYTKMHQKLFGERETILAKLVFEMMIDANDDCRSTDRIITLYSPS